MANERYFGAKAALSVTRPVGGAAISLAAIKEWGFVPRFDFVEDYDNESVFLGEVARIHGRVEVKLKVGMWNPVVGEMWMQDYLTAGVSGATAGTTVDTNQVGRYVVTGTVHPFGKTTNLKAIVSGVYLENFGVIGQQDTWNPMEVSGIGTSVVFSNPA